MEEDGFLQPEIAENRPGLVRFGLGFVICVTGVIGYAASAASHHNHMPMGTWLSWAVITFVGLGLLLANFKHVPRYR